MQARLPLLRAWLLLAPAPDLPAADPVIARSRTELSRWQPRLPETEGVNLFSNGSIELGAHG